MITMKLIENRPPKDKHMPAPFRDPIFKAALEKEGIRVIENDKDPYGVVLLYGVVKEGGGTHPHFLPETDKPIVVLGKIDGAQFPREHLDWLSDKRVVGYLKQYVSRDYATRRVSNSGRYHLATLMKEKSRHRTYPKHKIGLCWGFGRYERMRPFAYRAPNWEKERLIDVSFFGELERYEDRADGELIREHRLGCVSALSSLKGRHVLCGGNVMSKDRYIETMYDTKVVVSPWGYGEACYRDYEALLSGAILIKPRCEWVKGLIDLFASEDHLIWCEPDWSDLPAAVDKAMSRYAQVEHRQSSRAFLLQEWSNEFLARQIATTIKEFLK